MRVIKSLNWNIRKCYAKNEAAAEKREEKVEKIACEKKWQQSLSTLLWQLNEQIVLLLFVRLG